MQLFTVVAKKVSKNFQVFLPTKSWKNHPQKLLRIPQIHFFSLTALTATTTQTEEFLFQNVAYWLTVYRTGTFIKSLTPMCINFFHAFDDVMQD